MTGRTRRIGGPAAAVAGIGVLAALAVSAAPGGGAPDPTAARADMVRAQLEARGVRDRRVLDAMRKVERHRFVPEAGRARAYQDRPLPIGHGQTISQPYIVAAMTEAAALRGGERVLEVGTGSGYQAAVLAEIAGEVYTIEIVPALGRSAAALLKELGYRNVHVRVGDGYRGWPDQAPFHAILVTAAPDHVPRPLLDQLAAGGRLVLPLGDRDQDLVRYTRTAGGFRRETLMGVKFVPMTGEAQRKD